MVNMTKYISYIKYTAEGIKEIKESPGRLNAFRQVCELIGAQLEAFYLTMGRYDIVMIIDAPDRETVAKVLLETTSKGAFTTETSTAFTEDEYKKIIHELP
jgi:uncharacterized protein with GYD domain